ncbi:helix-turn-helix domain-containing protein [Metabacillus malikii]|uniref:Helix-turn-helix domain-containing protein n=1 Tax=Metabacillus malikii TaxID=1504265 RepID=A0ABT9ZCB3_9BACI|nr:helix-turn-helix domain-containing protein [Metabacillus malikii]MDQ0229903.1 hypothetical protein [Metabacillus malikii]
MEKLNFETIQKHQSFSTVEEMNQAVRGFLYKHKSELSEGTLKVLHNIWNHSLKVVGVSFAKYDYIAELVNLSRRTVIRAINVLVAKGFIKKIPTKRMNGKQGVNILVIQEYPPIDSLKNNMSPHVVTPNKTENNQSSLCENKTKPKNVKKEVEPSLQQLDASFLPDTVSKPFIEAAKPFFNAVDIYELWKRIVIVYEKMQLQKGLDDVIDVVIQAFKEAIFAKKRGKIKSTFTGYFYTIVYSKLIVEKRKEMKPLLYDFLNGY